MIYNSIEAEKKTQNGSGAAPRKGALKKEILDLKALVRFKICISRFPEFHTDLPLRSERSSLALGTVGLARTYSFRAVGVGRGFLASSIIPMFVRWFPLRSPEGSLLARPRTVLRRRLSSGFCRIRILSLSIMTVLL